MISVVSCAVVACREADGPSGPGGTDARLLVTSDPSGAAISLDDVPAGTTPDTIGLRAGEHTILLSIDSAGVRYTYGAFFRVARTDSLLRLEAPLAVQCNYDSPNACYTLTRKQHDVAGMRFATSAIGSIFHWSGSGQGLFWPGESLNSYTSAGMPAIAGTIGGTNVALGIYDQPFLAGRPAPVVTRVGSRFSLQQRAWIVPPISGFVRQNTVRGIEVLEEVIADDEVNGVVIMKLTFRNVTNEADYYRWASELSPTALTWTNTYIGFMLDPDIGEANDDWSSYDESLRAVFSYDAAFTEANFIGTATTAPGLVALRALRIPDGTHVVLNAWNRVAPNGTSGDWGGGLNSEFSGYNMLTGAQPYAPDHASPTIGHLPPGQGDARISVTAGPLTLAPGQQAEIVIALAIAEPVAGTYTPGTVMSPGDPLDAGRAIHAVAAGLRSRLQAAEALLPSVVRD